MLASGLLFGGSQAWAAAPPANTVIGNQATAAYLDPNGLTQSATSNIVRTTVQRVGSFALDSATTVTTTVQNTKTGAAGAIVYAPHVLTNTGNGADDFTINVTFPNTANPLTTAAVYADANFDGLPDSTTALCTATPTPVGVSSACATPAQTVVGSNGKFGFVVAYQIPGTVSTSIAPYAEATITAAPVAASSSLYASTNQSAANLDRVNTTTSAAFNLTKAVQQPSNGVNAPGGGAWPAAPVSGQRSTSATCSTTWSAGLASTAACQYTVYTLNYSNTGGASGRFVLQDVIGSGNTAGMRYVTGSAVWSGASGTALGDGAAGDPAGVDYAFDSGSNTMTFVDNALPVNVQRSVSFVVLVTSTAAVGTTSTNNVARYNPVDAGSTASTTSPGTVNATTNSAVFTVQGTYSIALGAASSTSATALDTPTAGTPNSGAADTTTVASAPAGAAVAFAQTVYNTGNDTDAVNITSANPGTGAGTAFPAGTTFAYYKADGTTQLIDTNADSIVDTGPIPAGGNVTIVVKAILPGTLAAASAANYTFTVTGRSIGDTSKVDATRNVLTAVTGVLVDLTNSSAGSNAAGSGDVGTGPSTQPTTTGAVTAGSTHVFDLWVKNNDSVANTYSLAASSTTTFPGTLPAGWTVKFVLGVATPTSCAGAAAITTVSVAVAGQAQLSACVSTPASQAPLTASPVYFQVRSTAPTSTGSVVVDTKYDALTVTAAALTYTATVTPNNSGQVASGGTVVYAHTIANTGTGTCGVGATNGYSITATLPAANTTAGWTTAIYIDGNSNGVLDSSDTLVTGPITGPTPSATLAPGATQAILVRVFAPGGAVANDTATATVTVTFNSVAGASCGAPSATDLSTVITGQIRLGKTQGVDASCSGTATQSANPVPVLPGQCITYVVTATNQGTATVSNMSINDAVPSFTTLYTTLPGTCTSTGITGTAPAYSITSGNGAVSCGSTTNAVAAGGTATLTFTVQVNQ